jgi:two-component system, NarL family, sensor histidine kinase UhpB
LVTTGLLLLLMLAGIALSFNNARNNTIAEIASAEKSTLTLFESAMLSINPSKPQPIDLNAFKLQQLNHMRHLKIELVDSQGKVLDSNQTQDLNRLNNEAPAWFVQLLNKTMPRWQPKIKSLSLNNQLLAKLIITPDPSYEYAEIWKQITDLLVLLALFFICVNLMIAWAIAQALKPTETILSALDEIEKGHLDARLPHFKLPEMARIGQKFNHMIETLQQSIGKNHQLTQQLMTLQEAERKSLARDLHDEFGQCLTAINTDASVILNVAKVKYPELQASAQAISQLSRHLMELVNGLLQRLRPGVLDELGLELALQDLVDTWRARNHNISCTLQIENADNLSKNQIHETDSLVIYRLVQESLTNIARHANAQQVTIHLYAEFKTAWLGLGVSVQDNGRGFSTAQTSSQGLGLAGMRERVESLGGDFSLQSQAGKGTIIKAWIPMKARA